MKIRYSPIKWNSKSGISSLQDTEIIYVSDNSITIDGELFEFDSNSVEWPTIVDDTDYKILNAYRDDLGELYLTIRRFYSHNCSSWDTGDYHDIVG